MATTNMWAVKSQLDHLVNYVSNPLKTVTQYVINDEKTLEKRYVSYLNCSFENPGENMENIPRNIIMMKARYLHFMVINRLKKMK